MSERTASIVVICGLILALLIPCEGKSQEYRTVAINADANMYERAQALRAVNELTSLGYPTRIVEANDNPDATLFFIRDSFGKFKQNELGRTMLGSIALVFVDRIQRASEHCLISPVNQGDNAKEHRGFPPEGRSSS